VFVACSTLCFGKYDLEQALHIMGELRFSKIDLAIHEAGSHLKPSEVAADVNKCAQRLKTSTNLTPVAFGVEIDTADPAEFAGQLRSICRLARITTTPVVTIPAAAAGSGLNAEVTRLTQLVQVAETEGIILAVETRIGTLTESPTMAVELCKRVPGLGIALDPSHYIAGPHNARSYDQVFPYVRHVRLRDTGRGPEHFQVRVGQGQIEYGRITAQLSRFHYERALAVDIRDIPDAPFPMEPEVRKLKYLLESLV
jgi:sugar phosphate isomerase/epimerase